MRKFAFAMGADLDLPSAVRRLVCPLLALERQL